MTIEPKPSVADFIGGAPDAEAAPDAPGRPRPPKRQLTITVDPGLVERVDALARRMGQTRSAMISLLAFEALEARARDEGQAKTQAET